MSRIHDALRRGPGPAGTPNAGRTAHADAVLTALGYRSDKPRVTRATLTILVILAGVGAAAGWYLMPEWRPGSKPAAPVPAATVAGNASRIAASAPVGAVREPPRAPVLEPRPAAVTVPVPSRGEIRDPKVGTPVGAVREPPRTSGLEARPRTDPRPSIPDPRPPAPAPVPDQFQLALYYQRSGDFEQALMHYRAALQRDEMHVEAHNNLGHLYLGKGLLEEAAREFQRVIAIDPRYVTARVNLSAAYFRLGRLDAAATEARAALQIDPRNPDAMVNLSLAQHAAGQGGDAQGSLRRALEIDPHNAAAHYNLALQFEAAGEVSAAIDHYRQFILYMGPDQAAFAADVRTRLSALAARLK